MGVQASQEAARAKEKDLYASDLAAIKEEKARVEQELVKSREKAEQDLVKAHEKAREAQTGQASATDASEQLKADFEARLERSKDEVEYLRKTCEEKESRIKGLIDERDSLASQVARVRIDDGEEVPP